MRLWIRTSKDKYRLIEDMDVNVQLLADRSGVDTRMIYSSQQYHLRTGADTRFMAIEIGEEDG